MRKGNNYSGTRRLFATDRAATKTWELPDGSTITAYWSDTLGRYVTIPDAQNDQG